MAESKIYASLKKLFSSDVVVRNIGGKQLKVVDVDQIQKFGTSSQNDRFTRMYSSINYRMSSQQALYGMESQRLRLFRDYEVMDNDAIISSALDIYSEETTMKNEMNEILRIRAGSDKVRQVLENLYYEILNIEFTLPTWVRGMCKYGDYFLKLELAENYGVTNVIPLPVYELKRIEGENPEKPNLVRYYLEGASGKGVFENFEIAHFRLLTDSNWLPYGKSMIEPARRVWKQLILMEDAMLIHRIMRAPERRVFKIDVGNIAPHEVDAYMKRIIAQIKKVPYIDPDTGEYNLKFNLQNMTEDFYLPVRGGDSGTEIDTLNGLGNDGQIEDIEYLRNKMMAALKIPKAFLGYEDAVGSKATLAAEDVRFARTIEKIQKIIVSELYKIGLIHLYIQGFKGNDLVDFDLSLTNPSIIYEQEKIELWNSKIGLARDMKDVKMLSEKWIYKNIFGMTDNEIVDEEKGIIQDQKKTFRLEQIEQEGNDPAESKQAFDDEDEKGKFNIDYEGYDPVNPSRDGRRGTKLRTRKKDEPFGEDPIGQKDYNKIMKLDGEINGVYDGNKKKHLSRKIKRAENILGKELGKKAVTDKKVIAEDEKVISQNDLLNLKNYFKSLKLKEGKNININKKTKDENKENE